MTLATYDVGDTVRLAASYTDTGGSPANPTTVRIIYAHPTGVETTAITGSTLLVNSTTGSFYTDLVIDAVGTWRWRATSTGNIVTSSQDAFVVRKQWVST